MKDYEKEYERLKRDTAEWCSIDLMNIGDKTKQAIGRKQWIVARLFDTKRELYKLQNTRKLIKEKSLEAWISDPENKIVAVDKTTLSKVDNMPEMIAINEQIKDCEFLVAYLEASVKMYTYIAQDIKNLIEAHTLQTESY